MILEPSSPLGKNGEEVLEDGTCVCVERTHVTGIRGLCTLSEAPVCACKCVGGGIWVE